MDKKKLKELKKMSLRNGADLDQFWAEVRDKEDNLSKIFENGPRSEDDIILLRQVAGLIIAEINYRKAEECRLQSGN